MNQKATTALLPDGKKLEERGGSLEDSPSFCKLLVDKSLTVFITTYQADEYYDPMDPKEAHRFSNRAKMKDIPAEWEGAIGDNYSTITTKCTGPSAKYVVTEISAKAGDDDTSQRRKDIQDFATEFTSGVKKKIGCTQ
ncbi:hypothetical protein [Streptomyces corynorhini]|uniref:DUF3558 domain-containing protein n=1 Tax=Streptomyces corynorhini TaxID=2282652 RepID=A0A370B7B8_9ACTN|nr:hypothetical protein [Streptomyces corynorhini]RDG37698.1 hypothetical protein DVH02_13095 [Streptomyces corynorhini]